MRLFEYLNEAVIKVSFGPAISKKLEFLEDNIYSILLNPLKFLNDIFNSENIFFEETSKSTSPGSIQNGHTTKGGKIVLFFNKKLLYDSVKASDYWDEEFIHDLKSILIHELTHKRQFEKMKKQYLKSK